MNLSTPDVNFLWSFRLLSTLRDLGVDHAVVSSGSRNTPLVLAAAHVQGLHLWTHPDERSAGFWALGIAKANRRPAALICTSGTAAANYLPAIIEAYYSSTPLVALTADRPPELRNCGAPQTIDQIDIYRHFVRFFRDMPAPVPGDGKSDYWPGCTAEAVHCSLGPPPGPVHLNLPFREPLIPSPERIPVLVTYDTPSASGVRPIAACQPVDEETWDKLSEKIAAGRRGVIVCGPQNVGDSYGDTVQALALATGYLVLADVASQLRFGGHDDSQVVSHYDLFLRGDPVDRLAPEVVLRFGGLPTSKALNQWLGRIVPDHQIAFDPETEIADPYRQVTETITTPFETVESSLIPRLGRDLKRDGEFRAAWREADELALSGFQEVMGSSNVMFEGEIVSEIFSSSPPGTAVFLSNSMPIRLADAFVRTRDTSLRVMFNRGANGIDGIVSSAVGAASVLDRPVVLIIGDITLMHDLGGLLGAQRYNLDLKIVLLNNNGGGIFSFLPVAEHTKEFDPLVAMPHGLTFEHAAQFYGIAYHSAGTTTEFRRVYDKCIDRPGPELIEVQTDRGTTAATIQAIAKHVRVSMERLS